MSFIRGLKRRVRLLKQRGHTAVIIKDRPMGAMSMEQRRHFRYDDRTNWPTGNPGESKVFKEEGFDPRYDERHYRSYRGSGSGWRTTAKDPESRRRIQQDTIDHQRRQERIIQENKHRWQHRSEPQTGIKYTFDKPIFAAGPKKPRDPAEDYSRRRQGRQQRQREVKRQERELRESRKNYNLPGYNRPAKGEESEAPVASKSSSDSEPKEHKTASRAWLEKQAREDELKYWHTWSTCPDERVDPATAPDASEEIMHGYTGPRGYQRGFVKPPPTFEGGVRRFQTHSVQLADEKVPSPPPSPPSQRRSVVKRRKPNGMDKQYRLARDFTRINRLSDESDITLEEYSRGFKRPASQLFGSSQQGAAEEAAEAERLQDIELPEQPPRMKLAWQGLPRPVYKRFDGIKRAVARKNRKRERTQPPRFQMTVKSKVLNRLRPPIDCFSSKLDIDTRYTPVSEYLGYGPTSVCDAWQNFTNKNSLKTTIY